MDAFLGVLCTTASGQSLICLSAWLLLMKQRALVPVIELENQIDACTTCPGSHQASDAAERGIGPSPGLHGWIVDHFSRFQERLYSLSAH